MNHSERSHALLSASGAHRWLNCPPSALLEDGFPDTSSDTSSEAAKEGTLAHELAELKVRNYFYTVEFGKRKLTSAINKLKKNELWQNEMMDYTDEYLDYIRSTALALPHGPYVAIEKRVDFSNFVPDGFGTADCILIGNNMIHVIDLKYGKSPNGRVSAENNPQMMLYALGAYESYKILYPIKTIKMTIVQPRLPDGISEWECTLDELLQFGEYARVQAALAIKGEGEFNPEIKTCQYCKVKGSCRPRAIENVKLAFFTNKKPALLEPCEIGDYLLQGEGVSAWLSDLQEYALSECLAGNVIDGWKAVEGRGSRDWSDMDMAFDQLKEKGLPEELLWEKKPLTLAQVEKVVGKKEFSDYVGNFVIKRAGKPTLVKSSDRREAITNKISAKDAFKEII